MIFGRWEVVDGKRHVITRLARPNLVFFNHLVWQDALDIVKVDGLDLDIWEESVLIDEHCATSAVGHVEPVREELVISNVISCHLPAICFSTAPSLPRHCRSDTPEKMCRVFWRMLRGILRESFQCRRRAFPK